MDLKAHSALNMALQRSICFLVLTFSFLLTIAQTPRTYTSSEILLQIKKLNVLGSVLYIAAHPDDENTRMLAYLANEKLYRTGYLSLTRGDGGQNLIGDEQGVDLGLIRTQELLAARRIDGAEQFFTRAFDFGYSKSPDETLRFWGHDKILSDIIWVIRKFRPDVIITRFPTTGEGGHGHHTASAILAGEAFDAAADPAKFPEQLKNGVRIWKAKRLLWNTFNFGGNNTQNENQFKLDCGDYNPMLGKSYGEIAATSRSQHKSQGFGVPAQRGPVIEYFRTISGEPPVNDLMDGVNISWDRLLSGGQLISRPVNEDNVQRLVDSISRTFSIEYPERSIEPLVRLYKKIESFDDPYWREQKLSEVKKIIENCSGLFIEATTNKQFFSPGDSMRLNLVVNPRLSSDILNADAKVDDFYVIFDQLKKNVNAVKSYTTYIPMDVKPTQPYWLEIPMEKGSFTVNSQEQIGKAESDPLNIDFSMMIFDKEFIFNRPIRYKHTDPVKGELYQPVSILPVAELKTEKDLYLVSKRDALEAKLQVVPNSNSNSVFQLSALVPDQSKTPGGRRDIILNGLKKENNLSFPLTVKADDLDKKSGNISLSLVDTKNPLIRAHTFKRVIDYDHIPSIIYQKEANVKSVYVDLKTEGSLVGYIPGAGDKIPEALQQMGYKVITLKESDMNPVYLRQFDAIVSGVRAYNTQEWLIDAYDALMQYTREGGVLMVQYNTNNQLGPVKAKISPYPFTIGRNRITDEEAKVNFLLPEHPALNFPNKITEADFSGWIQERSIYHPEKIDSNYSRILSMKDPGEKENDGSLIIANYGKGRFVYTGLVFFRQLPAGVPGAYRLFANLIANKRGMYVK